MNCSKQARSRTGVAGIATALIVLASTPLLAQAPAQPPPLPAETSDVATLPPAGPHRVFVMAGLAGSGANVVDADAEGVKLLGLVPMARNGFMALSRDASRVFVIETFYSRGNRGTREDVLAVYDGLTLNLLKEVVLPGRILVVPRPQIFDVSEDARLAYVYDMSPAAGVHVVDLEQGKLLPSVDMPGCALAFPYGPRGFASVCGDGTLGAVQVPDSGTAKAVFSKPFFDVNTDPIFESSVIDKTSGEAWFMSYTGKLFPARLGTGAPVIDKPWTITAAAGMPVAGTGVQELAWRPGGEGQILALHRASKRLYVLMHTGNYWTHKRPGTEVWVLDAVQKTLLRRIMLDGPTVGINVSQDEKPQLYAMGEEGEFAVLDATTGEKLRKRKLTGGLAWVPGM